ncbi:caspase family protein [Streptomyces sp. NPDC048436]|uniref:HD domain-containing protein n=1 Tax=Streptomyces sp. NPDC048436 TaxID=3365550 RepID=UPI003722A1DB
MEQTRTALLIGVAATPDAAHHFAPLEEPVAADQRALGAALRAAGYHVETVPDGTRAAITTAIDEVARSVPADGTLLLHFSGHGIRIDGTDYLVPSDARAPHDGDWRRPHRETLVPADISAYLSDCRAGTVLWLVDACRDEPSGGAGVFGSGILRGQPSGRFALITACAAGQRSGFTAEGSFFTQGLAEAFRPLTEARTVHEVYETARRHTLRSARRQLGVEQEPQIRYGSELDAEARETEVCAGRRLLDGWRDAASDTALWERVAESDAGLVPRFRECLATLVEECADVVHRAQERMPDPWADDDFPVRLLRDRLPGLVPKTVALSAVEAAALVAAPFLHEAAWARRLSHAHDISAYSARPRKDGDAWRRHYEQVAGHHPHIRDKLSACLLNGRVEEARDVALWLVHRWITERFETDEEPVPPVESATLAARLLDSSAGAAGHGPRVAELAAALSSVASGVALGAPLLAPGALSELAVPVPGGSQVLRVAEAAALVHLAATLALDVRTLPDVLAEHLAVFDPVLPQDAVNAVRDAAWHTADQDLALDAACPHPAVHAALAGVVEQADDLACALRNAAGGLPESRSVLLSGVPARVTDRALRAVQERGRRAYDVPLLRFQLAQTEVRDLFMGERIYDGEPDLALRELYQNAMDACRHRAMRRRYLEGRGGDPGLWEGRITVVEGTDERGRYVECRDNGVGMGLEQLKNTFTKAGRRFEQSRAFRQEQANWHRQDPALRLYPNSRFGIGVFSYFMLADEMTVVTRQVGVDGIPAGKALRVDIPGSGSLFRIQEHDDSMEDGLLEGGTRIRLYLRDSVVDSGLSPVSTLRRLVLVSEFGMVVEDASGRRHHWGPGELQTPVGPDAGRPAVEAVPGVLWWVHGKGAVLCDGIGTDRQPFGYVLNLTGPYAGTLSLNRKKLESYDRAWEARQWAAGASALASWEALSMGWLWTLERQNLRAARTLWQRWRGSGVTVRTDAYGPELNLDTTGWFHPDAQLGKGTTPRAQDEDRAGLTRAWRAAVLGHAHVTYRAPSASASVLSFPVSTAGHPVPEPGWAEVASGKPHSWGVRHSSVRALPRDWRAAVAIAYSQSTTVGAVLRAQRALRVAHPELGPPRVGEGDLDWTPDWCDAQIVEGLVSRVYARGSYTHEKENSYQHAPDDLGGLVRASAATSCPLGELADSCARFAPFLSAPPPRAPAHHQDHVCDETDLALLYVDDGARGWRRTRWPWDIHDIAHHMGISAREVLERLSGFAWLGWTAPDPESVRRWGTVPWEIRGVLRDFCVPDEAGGLTVPWGATFALAAEGECGLRKAEKEIARWADFLGLSHVRRHRGKTPAGRVVPGPETSRSVGVLHAVGIHLEDGLTLRDLAFARYQHSDWDDTAWVLEELREAGVDVPAAGTLLRAWAALPVPSRYAFSGNDPSFDAADYPVLPTADILFVASANLKTSLRSMWKTARREASRVGLTVPDLPASLADFRPGHEEVRALIAWDDDEEFEEWFEPPKWAALTAGQLTAYAREQRIGARAAYERLAPLGELGPCVPVLGVAQVQALPATVPDVRDTVALGGEHRVSPPGTPLCALDLVSLAGRLGEPVVRTWQRIVPYLPFEQDPGLPQMPDVLPLWQDLILLSRHADGMLPALRGPVTADQISFAAGAVGESDDWVSDRLRLFAALFELELPDTP